uniref:Uncharacterized protein n=1 Tax=Rhizophora mucronata TaxID=61149 RepID=A0A2P2NGK9_RHIMU
MENPISVWMALKLLLLDYSLCNVSGIGWVEKLEKREGQG